MYVSLGDNVNIDTGIISLYGDDTPSKLLFETVTVSEQLNNNGDGEILALYEVVSPSRFDVDVIYSRQWTQIEHTMHSNLNQNMDGLKEDELDLKDNEVLLKV